MRDRSASPRTPAPRRRVIDPQQFLVRQPWHLLEPLLSGASKPPEAMKRLKAYAHLLMQWNQGVSNLISQNDQGRFVERHLVESLAGAVRLRELDPEHVVDLGSGGGLPAIPLLLAGVGRRWTLVESRRNKTLFLRRAVQDLKLQGVEVKTGRLEALLETEPTDLQCSAFTSRATMRLGPTLEMAGRILAPGGHALLWKGSSWSSEVETDPKGMPIVPGWRFLGATTIGDGPNSILDFCKE